MFRVFISSVQKEFAAERRAIADYVASDNLLRRFFQVSLFEDTPASKLPSHQLSMKELGRADIYLGLLGNEYGYAAESGLSPTEVEFDRATMLGIHRLVFVKGPSDRERDPKTKRLIRKAGKILVRRRYQELQELLRSVYASLVEFLDTNGCLGEPEHLRSVGHDVFLSYASADSAVAEELFNLLSNRGLRCFMAKKSIKGGAVWREEIRTALRSSRSVLLLLTPNSINNRWVMCEVGAFWALMKPIIPAYMFIDLKELPELISEIQCKPMHSASEKVALAEDVWNICRS